MLEMLATAGAAWRTILHVSEWSGLSIGALAVCVGLFIYVPLARKFVIYGAFTVLVGWFCLLHADRVGRADVNAQWADARKAAIEADKERDTLAELNLERKYQPQLIVLQKQSDERKARADGYERKLLTLLSKNPAASRACELGAAADRVPRQR